MRLRKNDQKTHRTSVFSLIGAVFALLSLGCERPAPLLDAGRYFYRAGAEPCGTFELRSDGAFSDTAFCDGVGRVNAGLWGEPVFLCESGETFSLEKTLNGFVLTQKRQVMAFVFARLETCRAGLPKAPESPTL